MLKIASLVLVAGCVANPTSPPPASPPPASPVQGSSTADAVRSADPAVAPLRGPEALAVNSEVAGTLAPGEVRYYGLTITTPKHGKSHFSGLYEIELFVKAPPNKQGCLAAVAHVDLALIDKDDAVVNAYLIGEQLEQSNSDATDWKKVVGRFDFPAETFRVRLTARDSCSAIYRVRLRTVPQ